MDEDTRRAQSTGNPESRAQQNKRGEKLYTENSKNEKYLIPIGVALERALSLHTNIVSLLLASNTNNAPSKQSDPEAFGYP